MPLADFFTCLGAVSFWFCSIAVSLVPVVSVLSISAKGTEVATCCALLQRPLMQCCGHAIRMGNMCPALLECLEVAVDPQ